MKTSKNNFRHTALILFFLLMGYSAAFAQPANDNCSSAVSLTPGASCSNTAGTLNNATISTGPAATCVSGNLYDVWYRFTATSSSHTITISGYGSSFTRRQLVIYQGSCTGLSFVACTAVQTSGTNLSLSNTDLTPGATYYIRVIYPNTVATPITTNGTFSICVTTTNVANSPTVQVGKSYTNVSKPNGGVIQTNDILEFRSVIAVTGGVIYNNVYSDTIANGLQYIANSLKFSTNEGVKYQSGITGLVNLTDAAGDDEAVVSSSANIIRVNVPSLTRTGGQTVFQASPATTPITTASAGGGKIRSTGRPSFYSGTAIVMITYQVRVTETTGNIFTAAYGAFRYKTATGNTDDVTFPQIVRTLPRFSVYVSASNNLCASTVGLNNYTGGDFGSGTTRHDSSQLTIAPGYTWIPFASGTPNDGAFNVANNTSVNLSTNKYQPYNSSAIRVFGWWDIIGDHTNAANLDSGNFATPYGTNGGYMAVVNAAYGINNAVQKTINGLCTDTYYEFTAWFKNICPGCSCDTVGRGATSTSFKNYLVGPKNRNDSAGVTPDLTFQVDGVDYYTTGSIPYNKMWVKKGFLFRTGDTQSTATLTIRNNAPGGGGNDWVMDDIVLGTCLPSLELRPGNNPTYCMNDQVDLSVIVTSYYSNYVDYEWQRSTNGGSTWHNAPEMPGKRKYNFKFNGSVYKDTVNVPSFLSSSIANGYKYRVKTATKPGNLDNNDCSVYNSQSIFTININSTCDVLPVKLLTFNGMLQEQKAVLNWLSKGEENLQHYEIEKSTDGVNFIKIGTEKVKGAGVNAEYRYTFTDPEMLNGKVYYRLKMVAAGNASLKYSAIIHVTLYSSNNFELNNVINPFASNISFQLNAPHQETIVLQLLDIAGRLITQTRKQAIKGVNAFTLETPVLLNKGSYLLRIKTSNGSINRVIQHQ
jgi:trimeric autotransporter adhesin